MLKGDPYYEVFVSHDAAQLILPDDLKAPLSIFLHTMGSQHDIYLPYILYSHGIDVRRWYRWNLGRLLRLFRWIPTCRCSLCRHQVPSLSEYASKSRNRKEMDPL